MSCQGARGRGGKAGELPREATRRAAGSRKGPCPTATLSFPPSFSSVILKPSRPTVPGSRYRCICCNPLTEQQLAYNRASPPRKSHAKGFNT